jgi:hypothetical protein
VPVICRVYQIMKLCLDKTSVMRSIAQGNVIERRCDVCAKPVSYLHMAVLKQAPYQSQPVPSSLGPDDDDSCWRRPADFCRTIETARSLSVSLGWRPATQLPPRVGGTGAPASSLRCIREWPKLPLEVALPLSVLLPATRVALPLTRMFDMAILGWAIKEKWQ